MAGTVVFEGREWVDASIEYFTLPIDLQISESKWDRRLRGLGIRDILPDVRSTVKGDIADLEVAIRAPKSKYVVKSVWAAAVAESMRRMHEQARSARQGPDGRDAGSNEPQIQNDVAPESMAPLSVVPIPLAHNECFHHNGQQMHIKVYGERTVGGILLDARDVCASIGFRNEDMPDRVPVKSVAVCGSLVQTLSWEAFILLVFLKANGHEVAAEIKRWIVDTVFAVQFQGGAQVSTQAEYASRATKYSPATYTGALISDDFIIYAFDAFAAQALEDEYPGAVALITGDRIDTSRIIKIGIGKRERIQATRGDLNKILPGHDPRPILVLKVRGVANTDELKALFEVPLFEEFADYRIGHDGRTPITGPRNNSYTEMVVADPDTKEQIVRRMVSMVDDHHEKLWERTREELRNARVESHAVTELRMHLQLKDADMRTKETENSALRERCKVSEDRCKNLETTLTQILPRKLSVLKNMFRTSE